MRALVFFTAGFASILGLMLYMDSWLLRGIGLLALLGLCLALRGRGTAAQRTLIFLAGCIAGVLWLSGYQTHYLSAVEPLDGAVVHCVIQAEDYSRETAYGLALDGTTEINGKTYRVAAYLDGAEGLSPGDTIAGDFRLGLTTDEAENPSSYYRARGFSCGLIRRVKSPGRQGSGRCRTFLPGFGLKSAGCWIGFFPETVPPSEEPCF